jgi:hypothetical protein
MKVINKIKYKIILKELKKLRKPYKGILREGAVELSIQIVELLARK